MVFFCEKMYFTSMPLWYNSKIPMKPKSRWQAKEGANMRRRERKVEDTKEIKRILDESKYLQLGLCDKDQPYVVPMNYGYVYEEGRLTFYLHGATEGYKYELIAKNPKVAFALECGVEPFEGKVACQYGMIYSSIMGKGMAHLITDVEEKKRALTLLMKAQTGKDFAFNEDLVSIVNVIRIDVTEFEAKSRPLPPAMQK